MKTANYTTRKLTPAHAPIRTSIGSPRFKLKFALAGSVPELMPRREWLGLTREQYEKLYLAKLDAIGVEKIRRSIEAAASGKEPVLLCFCKLDGSNFCHRRLFAAWWHRRTGQTIAELEPPPRPGP